jgi:hypothetical protein
LIFDVPWSGLKREKMSAGNTRTTGDHPLRMIDENEDGLRQTASSEVQTTNHIFSIIKHYPPDWLKQIYEEETTSSASRSKTRSIDVEKFLKRSL